MLNGQESLSDSTEMVQELIYLRQMLSGRYRHVDEHLLDEAIEDALLRYHACPDCFDTFRGVPKSYYLQLWVRSYLDKRLRKEKRHRTHEMAAGISEKIFEDFVSGTKAGKGIYLGRTKSEPEVEEREEEVEGKRESLYVLMTRLSPHDRAAIRRYLAGASHEEWVRHLGIENLAREKWQRKIDAEKDRLIKKLRRWARKMGE